MAINITQFAPPSRVSSLVWDKNMEPPAGKVFEGDLVGNVTGDVTGDLTGVVRGSLLGYLSRNGVYSTTKGALVVPASSSTGITPTNVKLNLGGGGTYAIVDNTQKCFLENPCNIPVVLSGPDNWYYISGAPPYAKSYTSDNVEVDSISDSGNLNIYGASYIVLYGGRSTDGESWQDNVMSLADAYIDAGTSLILGDDTPPDGPKVSKLVWDSDMQAPAGKKFRGVLEGNVTGNVTGKTTYEWTMTPTGSDSHIHVGPTDTVQIYQLPPGNTLTGSIRAYISEGESTRVDMTFIRGDWTRAGTIPLTDTAQTVTIPKNTNGIYLVNTQSYRAKVAIGAFTIT